jgi:hypothetical protein
LAVIIREQTNTSNKMYNTKIQIWTCCRYFYNIWR